MKTNALSVVNLTDAKYSHNLRQWLKKQSKRGYLIDRVIVVESGDGRRYIGYRDDVDQSLIGSNFNGVICNGGREETSCWVKSHNWKEVKGFWAQYLRIGVCAIDSHHFFYPERWIVTGDIRTCNNCGRKERLRQWVEKIKREEWVKL